MSGLNATPGPWRVGVAGPNMCPTVGTEGGLMTAMVVHGEDHPTEANARLIAAAPDLFAVVEEWLAVGNDLAARKAVREKARAALRKARGE